MHLLQRADELGDENARPWLHYLVGDVEHLVGSLRIALVHAREGQEAAEQTGQPLFLRRNIALESLVQAELGVSDVARDAAKRALAGSRDRFAMLVAAHAVGHLELSLGAPDRVCEALSSGVSFVRDEGIVEPGAARFVVDHVEALVELGRVDEAVELLDWYEATLAG